MKKSKKYFQIKSYTIFCRIVDKLDAKGFCVENDQYLKKYLLPSDIFVVIREDIRGTMPHKITIEFFDSNSTSLLKLIEILKELSCEEVTE